MKQRTLKFGEILLEGDEVYIDGRWRTISVGHGARVGGQCSIARRLVVGDEPMGTVGEAVYRVPAWKFPPRRIIGL